MESDCLQAASLVNSLISNNSIFAFLLEEIKVKMEERSSSITNIRLTTNIASDYMENFGRTQYRIALWLDSGLEGIIDIVR